MDRSLFYGNTVDAYLSEGGRDARSDGFPYISLVRLSHEISLIVFLQNLAHRAN